jgi:hypothetical protein
MKELSNEEYQRLSDAREAEYKGYLEEFAMWLTASGLKPKTIDEHVDNAHTFLIFYMMRDPELGLEDGCGRMGSYLGDFFIYKCSWSSPTQIKRSAASLKKFYQCMSERGHVSKAGYQQVLADIKQGMPLWQQECREYLDEVDAGASLPSYYDELLLQGISPNSSPDSLLRQALANDSTGEFAKGFLQDLLDDMADLTSTRGGQMVLPTRDEVIGMLYLVTLYLSSWEERDPRTGLLERRAWANAGQNKIDALCRADFLEGTNRSKPLTVTIEGCCRAEILLEEMGLGFLLDEDGLGVTNAPTSGRPKLSFVPES